MEINIENEEDKGCLNLFHKGDVILYKGYYCLITDIDAGDDAVLLMINSFDEFDEYQNHWIGLSKDSEEDYTDYIIGVNLFPASQYHLSIVKNGN